MCMWGQMVQETLWVLYPPSPATQEEMDLESQQEEAVAAQKVGAGFETRI